MADAYVDFDVGSNANDGLTPDTPKKNISNGMAVRSGTGTLFLSRYCTWTGEFVNITTANVTVRGDWNNTIHPSYTVFPTASQIATVNRNDASAGTGSVLITAASGAQVYYIYCTGGFYGVYRNGACPGTLIYGCYSLSSAGNGFGADVGSGDCSFYYCTANASGGDGFNVHQTFQDNYYYCVARDLAGTSPSGDGFSNHDTAAMNLYFCQSYNNEDGAHQTASVDCIIRGCYFANNRDHQIRWEPGGSSPTLDATDCIFVSAQTPHLANLGMVGMWSGAASGTKIYLYNCIFHNRNTHASTNVYSVTQTSTLGKFYISGCQFLTDSTSLRAWYIGAINGVATDLGYCDYNSYQTPSSNTNRFRDGPSNTYVFSAWQAQPGTPDAHSLMYLPGLGVHSADPLTPDYYRPLNGSAQFDQTRTIPTLIAKSVQDFDQRVRNTADLWYVGAFLRPSAGGGGGFDGSGLSNFLFSVSTKAHG